MLNRVQPARLRRTKNSSRCLPSTALLLVFFSGPVPAQNAELGRVERTGNQATLTVDGSRPIDSAAQTLAHEFGIRVNVEDPTYVFSGDVDDGTPIWSERTPLQPHRLVPRGGRLQVRFLLNASGMPADIPSLVRSVVDAANAQFPFDYRLDTDGSWFSIVPTQTRDKTGRKIPTLPLLDRKTTVPAGTRSIFASTRLLTGALAVQTGLSVDCCQVGVSSVPWGIKEAFFEARDEPARSVLKRLIAADATSQPDSAYWLQRCDPMPSKLCAISLRHAARP